tara:strand:+ start:1010 stop:1345 length:336 start_codon:yes stop_codon:yes gene_type:complete
MTEKKGSSTPEESPKSDSPRVTAKDIPSIEEAIFKELNVYCKTEGEKILAREVALNRALLFQLQEAVQVRHTNYEMALATITQAVQRIDQLKVTNAVQMHSISKRLEGLED